MVWMVSDGLGMVFDGLGRVWGQFLMLWARFFDGFWMDVVVFGDQRSLWRLREQGF